MRLRLVAVAALALLPGALAAQRPGGRPAPVQRPRPVAPDTARRVPRAPGDTLRAPGDTIRDSSLVQWLPTDSVMDRLTARPGYNTTRYQGGEVIFDAQHAAFMILAPDSGKAAVQRGDQIVVADSSILYNDSTKIVFVRGRRIVLRDPSSGQGDVVGVGSLEYNLRERAGRISNPTFAIQNEGSTWYIAAITGKPILGDSASGKGASFYGRGGSLTSCSDSIPDYHFEFKEVKKSSTNTLVARPAVLYIRDIPVMWLPFIFQDTRGGRHSGILTPRFGLSDIVRNSPRYRRTIEDFGYYFAINDYMDARLSFDWRSAAGDPSDGPGWTRYKGEWKYNWLERYLSGQVATDYTRQSDGSTNLAAYVRHQQQFTRNSSISASMNYASNTTVQRQTQFNPYAVLSTIRSDVNYQQKLGAATLTLGGNRTQSPGRSEIQQTLPTVSLNSGPLELARWLTWTPSFSYSLNQRLHIDQPDPLTQRFEVVGDTFRTVQRNRNQSVQTLSFATPLRIFGYDLRNSFAVNDQRNDYPYRANVIDPNTGATIGSRIYTQTYSTTIDWNPEFQLPPLGHNKFNISPSVSLSNSMPGAFWVRTQLTNGRFVHQNKRPTFSLSASPTIYGFWPGFGPFTRLRHAISPTLSWVYAPKAKVDTLFLRALNQGNSRVLGLRQNALSFGLSTNIEAKARSRGDSATPGVGGVAAGGDKLKLLSVQFEPLQYDFERARAAGRPILGLTTERWGYTLSSDMLPGFSVRTGYSLFQGSTYSDTAKFSPVLDQLSAALQWNQSNNPFAVFQRLFGRAVPARSSEVPSTTQPERPEEQYARQLASAPVAGSDARTSQYLPAPGQGFSASLNFSLSKPRAPTGANVIELDPFAQCEAYRDNPSLQSVYEACRQQAQITGNSQTPAVPLTGGGAAYKIPSTINLGSDVNFQLTEKWTGAWRTSYDFVRNEFADHSVSLIRDLHDWRAVFQFRQAPNGNSSFSFFIALKAESDLKFDYHRNSVRQQR